LALAEQASLHHFYSPIGWKCPNFTTFQVEDILSSLHGSQARKPLTGLKKCRPQERQDALEVEYRIINMGSAALPDVEQPARQEATRSMQCTHEDLCLCPLMANTHQSFIGARLALASHRKVLGEKIG
jgi:hypothetical protein